jgi:hypothetical protein
VRRIARFLLLAGLGMVDAELSADGGLVCDRGLRPIENAFGYVLREDDHRCEGLYESTVRAVEIEVVSFTYGRLDYDLKRDKVLKVRAPDVTAMIDSPIRVRALALPLKAYYRMDSLMPEDGPLLWPLNDVLRPARLQARQLGLFGWAETDDGRVFIPLWARVEGGNGQASPAGAVPDSRIELGVRISGQAERVVWRVTEDSQATGWQVARDGGVNAGEVLRLAIPDGGPARLRLEVAVKWLRSDGWSTLRIDALRPG